VPLSGPLLTRDQIVIEIIDGAGSRIANSAEIAGKPLRATLLAEPFPGTVAQGVVLVFAKEFGGL
jgi:hypothetical protein